MEERDQVRRVWLVIEDRARKKVRKKTVELPLQAVIALGIAQDAIKLADSAGPVLTLGGSLDRNSSEVGAISWALRVAVEGEKKDPVLQEALLKSLAYRIPTWQDWTELIVAEA